MCIRDRVGAVIAAFTYWFFIEAHHKPKQSGSTYYRVSATDDSDQEGLLTHSKVTTEEVN